jgi:N-methylhydantoinase A
MFRIGIDTGGTFTDFIVLDGKRVRTLKLLSTPANPATAIFQGLHELLDSRDCDIRHGSTVATNALLERKAARIGRRSTVFFRRGRILWFLLACVWEWRNVYCTTATFWFH